MPRKGSTDASEGRETNATQQNLQRNPGEDPEKPDRGLMKAGQEVNGMESIAQAITHEEPEVGEGSSETLKDGSERMPAILPTLLDLLKRRDRVIGIIGELEALKEELDQLARGLRRGYLFDLNHDRYPDGRIKKTDVAFWDHVLRSYGLTSSMTEKAKVEWMDRIEREAPAFTFENCQALVQNMEEKYTRAAWETVREVYRQLIGCRYAGPGVTSKYDNLQRVEEAFRCRGNISWCGYSRRFTYQTAWRNGINYDDLLTACYLLEGRGKPTYAQNMYTHAHKAFEDRGNTLDTEFFHITCYKNGNQRVQWKADKLDTLVRFNKYGSEGGLPDPERRRYKPEHFRNGNFDPDAAREAFRASADPEFFPTPAAVVKRLVGLAELDHAGRYLEPSAGEGAIARALCCSSSRERVTCVELVPERARVLEAEGFPTVNMDFLQMTPTPVYDRIVMNPPFHNQADLHHVLHALKFLVPKGRLVSVLAAGVRSRSSQLAEYFRTLDRPGRWSILYTDEMPPRTAIYHVSLEPGSWEATELTVTWEEG